MIWMHNESGYIFEMLILSLCDENNETYSIDGTSAFRFGSMTLHGVGEVKEASMLSFWKDFTFIGFI